MGLIQDFQCQVFQINWLVDDSEPLSLKESEIKDHEWYWLIDFIMTDKAWQDIQYWRSGWQLFGPEYVFGTKWLFLQWTWNWIDSEYESYDIEQNTFWYAGRRINELENGPSSYRLKKQFFG